MSVSGSGMEGQRDERGVQGPEEGSRLVTRRRVLSYLSGLLSAVIAAVLGLPLVRFYVGNAFRTTAPRWLKLGPRRDIAIGHPHLFRVSYVDQDGWRETTRRDELYAVTEDGRDYIVLSNVCTHLGCPVRWDDEKRRFLCPCHGGVFDIGGRVVKGPPPRPLAQVEHKLEEGVLYVRIGGARVRSAASCAGLTSRPSWSASFASSWRSRWPGVWAGRTCSGVPRSSSS
jgi:menaquinol-cytochrome c reductase iron-sulfur subunit